MVLIVINKCYCGTFNLSLFGQREYLKRKGKECYYYEYDCDDGSFYKVDHEKYSSSFCLTKDYGDGMFNNYEHDDYFYSRDIPRDDLDLIAIINEFGSEKISSPYANLVIVEVPDGVDWEIEEYDGYESIHEKHRSWR
jgi:hypothetical protein